MTKLGVKQQGFSIVQIFLLIIVAGIIAGTGWVVWQNRAQESKVTSFAQCKSTGNPVTGSYPQKCTAGGVTYVEKLLEKEAKYLYQDGVKMLVIKDWGVALKLTDADMIKLTIYPKSNINPEIGPFQSFAKPTLSPAYTSNKDCEPRVNMYRSQIQFKQSVKAKEINGFYYAVSGFTDLVCNRRTTNSSNEVVNRFFSEFSVDNLIAY